MQAQVDGHEEALRALRAEVASLRAAKHGDRMLMLAVMVLALAVGALTSLGGAPWTSPGVSSAAHSLELRNITMINAAGHRVACLATSSDGWPKLELYGESLVEDDL